VIIIEITLPQNITEQHDQIATYGINKMNKILFVISSVAGTMLVFHFMIYTIVYFVSKIWYRVTGWGFLFVYILDVIMVSIFQMVTANNGDTVAQVGRVAPQNGLVIALVVSILFIVVFRKPKSAVVDVNKEGNA
jgi:hypothetical protein